MKASDPKRVSDEWSGPVFGEFAWIRDVRAFLVRSSYARFNGRCFSGRTFGTVIFFQVWSFWRAKGRC